MKLRKKLKKFSGIGMVCLALIMALGLMGVGYASWVDTVIITNTVHVGVSATYLNSGTPRVVPSIFPLPISCLASGNDLNITLTPILNMDYTVPFYIYNTGSLPVKVASIVITGLPAGVGCDSNIPVGTQIDPELGLPGQIHIYNTGAGSPYTLKITYSFSIWNN